MKVSYQCTDFYRPWDSKFSQCPLVQTLRNMHVTKQNQSNWPKSVTAPQARGQERMLSETWSALGDSEEIRLILDWVLVSSGGNSKVRNLMIFFLSLGCKVRERPLLTLQSVEDILGVSTRYQACCIWWWPGYAGICHVTLMISWEKKDSISRSAVFSPSTCFYPYPPYYMGSPVLKEPSLKEIASRK